MPRLSIYNDVDLAWGLVPRSERSSRLQADDNGPSSQWWEMHTFFVSALVIAMVMCLGIFEYVRFSTFILEATCFVEDHEIIELGACSVCKGQSCSLYPKAKAKMTVTFRPLHWKHNVTGIVSLCNNQDMNMCSRTTVGSLGDPSPAMGVFRWQNWLDASGFVPWPKGFEGDDRGDSECDFDKVYRHVKTIRAQPDRKCYYNSREPGGIQVWFSEQSPVQRGALEVVHRQGVPLLAVFCAAALFLATLLGCLSLVD